MIRGLAVLVGLSCGAVLGALAKGTVGHLALVPGLSLPGWVAQIAPEAGLPEGRADMGAVQVRWDLAPLRLALPRWNVKLTASGAQATGQVGPELGGLWIHIANAQADLGESLGPLLPGPEWRGLNGELVLQEPARAQLAWDRRLQETHLAARALALSWKGADLGAIDLRLAMSTPIWRATVHSVPDNPLEVRGVLSGLSGSPSVQIDLTVTDTPALSDAVRRALSLAAEAGTGPDGRRTWRVGHNLVLPRALP